MIGGADYSFISPEGIFSYRDSTNEPLHQYLGLESDPSKRVPIADISRDRDNTKLFTPSTENEPFNEGFGNNTDSSNELRQFGPSIDIPEYTRANADWWDHIQSSNPRPYLFPVSGSIDQNMRPSGPEDYIVERVSKAGSIPANIDDQVLSWRNSSQALTVGSRGEYQKLESIGIYKSLEVLSEGPIAGLANPITCLLYTSPSPRDH